MKEIKINLEVFKKNRLDISEYLILYGLYHKTEEILEHILYKGTFLVMLEDKGYIKRDEGEIILRDKALELFEQKKTSYSFESFWADYPIKVASSTGGYRVIKSKDLDSKQAKECKTKFNKLVKIPGEDMKIKVGLENYLKSLRPTLQFCVGVEVFLNQQMYQRYCDLEVEVIEEKTKGI